MSFYSCSGFYEYLLTLSNKNLIGISLSENLPPWKEPKQARSKQRFDHILDVAAEMFAEVGFENTTTNAIAERADVPIGSIYQYFGSKDVILQALSARYLAELDAIYQNVFPENPEDIQIMALLDATVDPFVEFEVRHPGFGHVFLRSETSQEVAEATLQLDEAILQQIQRMVQVQAAHLTDAEARTKATVVKAIIKAMIGLIQSEEDAQKQAYLLMEMKLILKQYVESA